MNSSKRNLLLFIVGALASAYAFHRSDTFWGIVVALLAVLWALAMLLPVMDGFWRFKVGLASVIFAGSLVALWPTVHSLSHGKVWCPKYIRDNITFAIEKGLDLQGGARLVYTVGVEDAIRDKRDRMADDMRQALAVLFGFHTGDGLLKREEATKLEEKVHVATPETSNIRLKFKDAADVAKLDERFLKRFIGELGMSRGPGPDEVGFKIKGEVETDIREKAVKQAQDTVNRRIDELGLREASVTVRDEDVIVEIPGQDEATFNKTKDIIQQTARLEFKMLDDEADFFGKHKVDEALLDKEGIVMTTSSAPAGPGKNVTVTVPTISLRKDETMVECRDRFRKFLKENYEVPDDHVIGVEKAVNNDPESTEPAERGWYAIYLYARAEVTGDYIIDARVSQDQQRATGGFYVAITFNQTGGERFEEVTGANIKRRFAIILDDIINSAPVIQSKIGGGHASITMGGGGDPQQQLEDARRLEMVLKSGALPAPISLSNESKIGPSLGEDSIAKGAQGAVGGSLLVLIFMVIYYRKAGVVADMAVLMNLILQMAIMASFSGTMTLPGIAGLALTIGMAVDANVLINERIREELRAGRTVRAAVEAGYEKAFSSIVDGHVTVFISGLILAQYGTGPVKGFAVTLIIGIVCSLYTGVFCTRLVFDWWARGAKLKSLSVGAEFGGA